MPNYNAYSFIIDLFVHFNYNGFNISFFVFPKINPLNLLLLLKTQRKTILGNPSTQENKSHNFKIISGLEFQPICTRILRILKAT